MNKYYLINVVCILSIFFQACNNRVARKEETQVAPEKRVLNLPLPVDSYKIKGNIDESGEIIHHQIESLRQSQLKGYTLGYSEFIMLLSQNRIAKDAFHISKLVADRDTVRAACKQVFFDLTNFDFQKKPLGLSDSVRRLAFYYLFLTYRTNKQDKDYHTEAILTKAFGDSFFKYDASQILFDSSMKIPDIPLSKDLYDKNGQVISGHLLE